MLGDQHGSPEGGCDDRGRIEGCEDGSQPDR